MKTEEKKSKTRLSTMQLAAALRALADALEDKTASVPEGWPADFRTIRKLSLKIKPKNADLFTVKVKSLRIAGPAPRREAEKSRSVQKDSRQYSQLKKQMKKNFNAIGESLAAGVHPDKSTVTKFLRDSKAMTTYPDMGSAYYAEYLQAIDRLDRMLQSGSLDEGRIEHEKIRRLKNQCHKRFK